MNGAIGLDDQSGMIPFADIQRYFAGVDISVGRNEVVEGGTGAISNYAHFRIRVFVVVEHLVFKS